MKQRLSSLQWAAVAVAAISVLFAAVAYGTIPWFALGLAFTFGMYGLLRKRTGDVDGITALTIETLSTTPLAILQLLLLSTFVGLSGLSHGTGITVLLLMSGLITAIPLVLFGEAARRLPLSYLGFIQFLTPILTFIYGFFIVHEDVTLGRWVGLFGVWCALIMLVIDMLRTQRRGRFAAQR